MEYSIIDFSNVLHIRNQIAFLDKKKLQELYRDKGNYLNFIDTFVVLTNIDSGFLLFSYDFLTRVEDIIQLNRFSFQEKDINEVINSIITYINNVRMQTETYNSSVRAHYFYFQQDIRNTKFKNNKELINSLGYDAYVIDALRDHDLSTIGEDKLFLASINSFLELIPELFDDEEIQKITLDKMNEITKHSGLFQFDKKKYCTTTEKHYQKVLKGE